MKNINVPMLFLAILVVAMFFLVGLAIAFRNIWFILLFLILGFAIFGYGLSLKKEESDGLLVTFFHAVKMILFHLVKLGYK